MSGMIYPLLFKEIFRSKIWGGSGIGRLKGLTLPDDIGESLEVSGMQGEETVVANGTLGGLTLQQILQQHGVELLGRKNFERFGTHFPLLVKFISTADDLSIQVHPDDGLAQAMGRRNGKSEMWYVVRAEKGARVLSGFAEDFSEERCLESIAEGRLCEHINALPVQSGDCFFIPAGRIHSIGAGCLLIEIQQSSDDTFRVYDFDRKEADGFRRTLHLDEARQALSYEAVTSPRTFYTPQINTPVTLVDTPQFTVRLCRFTEKTTLDYSGLDSFVCFVVFEGEVLLTDAEGRSVKLAAGSTVLFPAENPLVNVEPLGGSCGFIETYV